MKTIEELAQEYVDSSDAGAHPYNRLAIVDAYIAGAKNQREELTQWYDPKEELPDDDHCVLIKIADGPQERIHIGSREGDVWMADGGFLFHTDPASVIGYDGVVIGWRPIHE